MRTSVLSSVALALALPLTVAACGGDDAVAKYSTSDAFIVDLAKAECGQSADKEGAAYFCGITPSDACITKRKGYWTGYIASQVRATRKFASGAAENAVSVAGGVYDDDNLTKDEEKKLVDAVQAAFPGNVAQDGECGNDYDCQSGFLCALAQTKRCAKRVARNAGEGCGNLGEVCGNGSFCNPGVGGQRCDPQGTKAGDPCVAAGGKDGKPSCASGFFCDVDKCKAVGGPGAACTADTQCDTGYAFCLTAASGGGSVCSKKQLSATATTCSDFK